MRDTNSIVCGHRSYLTRAVNGEHIQYDVEATISVIFVNEEYPVCLFDNSGMWSRDVTSISSRDGLETCF